MLDAPSIACPEFLSIGGMLKATPHAEGERRFVYFEASNEGVDQQGETVAAKALADSADYFKKYGNLDIDHVSMIGAKAGIADYPLYEIGLPTDVGQRDGRTFVKGELYRGEKANAARANQVWDGLTAVQPPQRWYPSVGGAVLGKSTEVNEAGERGRTLITKVRWSNLAVSRTPVNQHVAACATVPFGVFAKCWSRSGLDIEAMTKALEAGYGTDSATFTGGAALREQSLDGAPKDYFSVREKLAGAMRRSELGSKPGIADLHAFCTRLGCSEDEAAQHVERFARDLKQGLKSS